MSDVLLEQPQKPREKDTLYWKVFTFTLIGLYIHNTGCLMSGPYSQFYADIKPDIRFDIILLEFAQLWQHFLLSLR